jgi:thiamine biosynthesis lipoprotein
MSTAHQAGTHHGDRMSTAHQAGTHHVDRMSTAHQAGTHHVEYVMGMAVSIDIRDEPGMDTDPRRGLAAVLAWLHHVDETFSPYRDDSPISRLGRAEITLDDVSDEVCEVLVLCDQLTDTTGGAFDAFAVPAPNGTMLDPSGLVKGWSIERSAHLLEAHGLGNFLINAGGDLVVRGRPAPGQRWVAGIRHPEHADSLAAVLDLAGPVSVATSATYERGAHIIYPRTGQTTTELASVTVVGPDLTFTDAFATAMFVMGAQGLDWLASQAGYDGMIITHDDLMFTTPGFSDYQRELGADS